MFRWEKLSPDEFKTFQEYVTESAKTLVEAVEEFTKKITDTKNDIIIDYNGFSLFLSIYIETPIPEELQKNLFVSFLKKPHQISNKNHGHLSKSDSNTLSPTDKSLKKSPISSISEPNEIRSMPNFIGKPKQSLLRRISSDVSNGKLILKDLICCLSLLEAGRPEDKLEFMFRLYDTDGNGVLDSEEIEYIINHMMTVARYSGWDVSELKPNLQEMMKEVDSNGDGCVTMDEWMKAGSSNIPLMVLLGVDTVVQNEGCHCWELKHFNRPAYCNNCSSLLVGLGKQGLRCIYCKYCVHERCVKMCKEPCIQTYNKTKIIQATPHHWIEGNCLGRCDICNKYIKSYNKLTGKKCRWCKALVHNKCCQQMGKDCDMGIYKEHILSPSQISPTLLNRRVKRKSTSEELNSCSSLNSIEESSQTPPHPPPPPSSSSSSSSSFSNLPSHALQLVPLPNVIPLLVFVNPKSGGKQGKSIMKKFQYILNPRQIFNVANDNGFIPGLSFFKSLPSYKILCCGGDGTIGWLLESMDKMNYDENARPSVAILPLGTGNDLARSLKWGGGYEGEDICKILDKISNSTIVMMDRWSINISPSSQATPLSSLVTNNKSIKNSDLDQPEVNLTSFAKVSSPEKKLNDKNENNSQNESLQPLASSHQTPPLSLQLPSLTFQCDDTSTTIESLPILSNLEVFPESHPNLNQNNNKENQILISKSPNSSTSSSSSYSSPPKPTPLSSDQITKPPCNIINNYFSIGVDASIAHRFHVMREKHPEKFNSRMKNKLMYLEYGTSESLRATCKNLHESVIISCDDVPLDLIHGKSMEGVSLLNIPYIYGGSNLWGDGIKTRRRKKVLQEVGTLSEKELSSGSTTSVDLSNIVQDIGDGMVELVGLLNTMHMARVKGGIHSGKRLAQCSYLTIETTKEFPMQIDGEPWIQPPCFITISHKNQVPMLLAPTSSRKSVFSIFSLGK